MKTNLFMVTIILFASTGAYAQPLTLDEAIACALANNPAIQAARENAKAARARIPQAYTPENPEVGVMFDKTPINTFNVEDAMSIDYRVKQNIPFPGKLVSAGKAAKNDARAATFIEKQVGLDITANVKKAFFNFLLVNKKIEIEKYNRNLFKRYAGVAETRYATGVSAFDDPIKASLEASEFENKLNELAQENAELVAALGYLLGEEISQDTELAEPDPSKMEKELNILMDAALKNQPELKAVTAEKDAAKARLTLAKQQYIPDIMTEFAYNQQKDQQNAWTASFGISVPMWFLGRQQPVIRETSAMHKASVKTLENSKNNLKSLVIKTYEGIKSSERIVNVYKKTILPKAEAALRSAETSYGTGRADFLNLADSARKLREYQTDYWQARTNYETAVAEMETLTGGSL